MDMSVEVGDWTFVPAADEDAKRVDAFLAVNTGGELIGANVGVVLYSRGTDDSWQRLAWLGEDPASSIKGAAILTDAGVSDATIGELLNKAGIVIDPSIDIHQLETSDPEIFGKGVFEADPYNAVIETLEDPSMLVTYLVDVGYPAANVDIKVADLNFEDTLLDIDDALYVFAQAFEASLKQPVGTLEDVVETYVNAQTRSGQAHRCSESIWKGKASGWSAWSCGSWTQVGAATPSGGRPTLYDFHYRRYGSREKTRLAARICKDCSWYFVDQTKTQQAYQKGTALVAAPNGTPPDPSTAPAGPSGPVPAINTCNPTEALVEFNWSPSPPQCP